MISFLKHVVLGDANDTTAENGDELAALAAKAETQAAFIAALARSEVWVLQVGWVETPGAGWRSDPRFLEMVSIYRRSDDDNVLALFIGVEEDTAALPFFSSEERAREYVSILPKVKRPGLGMVPHPRKIMSGFLIKHDCVLIMNLGSSDARRLTDEEQKSLGEHILKGRSTL